MHDGWIDSAAHYAGWRQVQSGIEHLWQFHATNIVVALHMQGSTPFDKFVYLL